ncbi:putative basic amino acid antiporter YfcC [Altererythrobacter sp. BO-6]|nr:putative basic amino acid antiporter YfcC [Altererythrobacter sp. BO-6]
MAENPVSDQDRAETVRDTRAWRMPDTLAILFVLALVAWAATFVFTPGQFSVAGDPARIVPGSYQPASGIMPAPLLGNEDRTGFLDFLFAGLVTGDRYSATVGLMAFIVVLGGVFGMIMRTGAVDAAVQASLPGGRAENERLVIVLFVAFSLAGAVFGLSEEAIALTLVLAPALNRAGYDAITAMLVCYGASQIGFATSWMNPFSVIIAQSIAGLPPMSGLGLRAAVWAAFTVAAAVFTWRYARAVRTGLRGKLQATAENAAEVSATAFTRAHGLVLLVLIGGVVWVAWGVTMRGYYLAEIAAQFFAVGIVTVAIARIGRIAGCSVSEMMEAFRDGAAQLLPAAVIVGAAKGIMLILGGDDPASWSLLNSLLNGLGSLTAAVPDWLTALAMYLVQSVFNFFVASGSGQASITMPIMAPLADLSGVSRQTAVLAFQLGDGLTNLVIPTSAVLMACLAAAKVSYGEWLAFIWRPMLGLMAMASAVMLMAHSGGY